jgi:hypothetical protein
MSSISAPDAKSNFKQSPFAVHKSLQLLASMRPRTIAHLWRSLEKNRHVPHFVALATNPASFFVALRPFCPLGVGLIDVIDLAFFGILHSTIMIDSYFVKDARH